MARLVLVTSHDPRRLLGSAADGFLRPDGSGGAFPSPDYVLVLRQGGLRDDLIAMAAKRGVPGWFDPPIRLFSELPLMLGGLERDGVGEFQRIVLVGRALRDAAGPVFRRIHDIDAYADAADRWFGELIGEGITPDRLEAALGRILGRDAFAARRDGEVAAAYRRYLQLLEEAGLRDTRGDVVACAAAIRADPDAVPARLGNRRELRLVGLADPRGGWVELLRSLRECPSLERVAVHTSDRLAFVEEHADEVIDLDSTPHHAATLLRADVPYRPAATTPAPAGLEDLPLFASTSPVAPAAVGPSHPPFAVEIVSAPDLPREVEEVAVRVRALIRSGVEPHRIAVVARRGRPYTGHVIRALERANVPASARVRHTLPTVPAIRALLALFRVAAEGWERHGLVELAETPYLRSSLDAWILNHIGYRRRVRGLQAWRDAIAELAEQAESRERRLADDPDDEDARRNPLPAAERVRSALQRFDAFIGHARELEVERSIPEWLEWLTAFLEADPWRFKKTLYQVPGDRMETVRLDTVAWRGVLRVLEQWAEAEGRWGERTPLPVAEFEKRLRAMLDGSAALYTPTRRGVQVLEALAASFRAFDHVFIVGLDSNRVPLRPPPSPLMDEQERLAMRDAGLRIDCRADWREREEALFRNLMSMPTVSLTLTYARYDEGGAEQLPSSFLEEVQYAWGLEPTVIPGSRAFTPGMPLAADGAAIATAVLAARAEAERERDLFSPYNGCIEHPMALRVLAEQMGEDRPWSATQIESYAKCPWAYFSSRLLRLDKREDPDLDIDALTKGVIYHDALRRFYEAAAERVSGPVFLRGSDLEWARPLAARAVEEAVEAVRATAWVGHPALAAQKLEELKRLILGYIEWEADDNDEAIANGRKDKHRYVRTGVIEHELRFDDVEVDVGGVRLKLRGSIDRVERGIDTRGATTHFLAAVDYKTSKYSTPGKGEKAGWDDGVVLQVPLYAHLLAQLYPGSATARVEYRTIKRPQRVHALALYQFKGNQLVADETAVGKYGRALADVARHVGNIRDGIFPPDPPASCNCPPFCHGRDICRIPGGPRGDSW